MVIQVGHPAWYRSLNCSFNNGSIEEKVINFQMNLSRMNSDGRKSSNGRKFWRAQYSECSNFYLLRGKKAQVKSSFQGRTLHGCKRTWSVRWVKARRVTQQNHRWSWSMAPLLSLLLKNSHVNSRGHSILATPVVNGGQVCFHKKSLWVPFKTKHLCSYNLQANVFKPGAPQLLDHANGFSCFCSTCLYLLCN